MDDDVILSSTEHEIISKRQGDMVNRSDRFTFHIPFSVLPDEVVNIISDWDIICFSEAYADTSAEELTLYYDVEHGYTSN